MRVAVRHQADVWMEVDLKTKKIDSVIVNDEAMSKPIEYHVILDDGVYDMSRYAGRKMARATRKVIEECEDWPTWQVGY